MRMTGIEKGRLKELTTDEMLNQLASIGMKVSITIEHGFAEINTAAISQSRLFVNRRTKQGVGAGKTLHKALCRAVDNWNGEHPVDSATSSKAWLDS